MKIKGIVFDKDGTLIDYESCWVERTRAATKRLLCRHGAAAAYDNIMKRMGILPDGTVDISGALCHGTYADIAVDYSEELSSVGVNASPAALLPELRADFDFYKHLSVIRPACDDIEELFKHLEALGVKLALVTTDDREGAERTLSPLGIFSRFDLVLCSDGVHPTKPDPYYMNLFMAENGLHPDEVLMVGDTRTDMLFGKNAGVHTLAVARTEKNRELLLPYADFVSDNISKIPEILENIG